MELSIVCAGKTPPGSPLPRLRLQGVHQWAGLCSCERTGPTACVGLELGAGTKGSRDALRAAAHLLGCHPEASLSPSDLLELFQVPTGTGTRLPSLPPRLWKVRQEKEQRSHSTLETLLTR